MSKLFPQSENCRQEFKKLKKKWIIAAAACILAIVSGCADGDEQKTKEESVKETSAEKSIVPSGEGDALPLPVFFEGQDTEGNTVTSSDLFSDSKLTMVNVWATYCSYCLKEMPYLGELAGEYAGEDFQVIGIVSDVQEGDSQEKLDLVTELIDKTEADYPHLLVNESLYHGLLEEIPGVPTTFFFNEKGMVLDTVVGAKDKDAWKEMIDAFLNSAE